MLSVVTTASPLTIAKYAAMISPAHDRSSCVSEYTTFPLLISAALRVIVRSGRTHSNLAVHPFRSYGSPPSLMVADRVRVRWSPTRARIACGTLLPDLMSKSMS